MFYPKYTYEEVSLDGLWDFEWLGDEEKSVSKCDFSDKAAVPSVFDVMPKYLHKRGVAVYRLCHEISESSLYRIRVGAVGMRGALLVDGKCVAKVELPYEPMEADVQLDKGIHEIRIAVDNRFSKEREKLFRPDADMYAFGGIFRSVTIRKLSKVRIENVVATVKNLEEGIVSFKVKFVGVDDKSVSLKVKLDNKQFSVSCDVVNGEAIFDYKIKDCKLWYPENPYLYVVQVCYQKERFVTRFGMREICVREGKLFLNGNEIYLTGANKHESHPQFGPVQSTQQMVSDIAFAKNAGMNFFRCVHYPHDERFFDICDEMGMLCWEESLGWGNSKDDITNKHVLKQIVDMTRRMVERHINHPSIIIWAFLNEADSGSDESVASYKKIIKSIKQIDDTRIVSYASNHYVNDKCFDLVDLISINTYPSWCSHITFDEHYFGPMEKHFSEIESLINKECYKDKAVIISEMGACGVWGMRDYGRAQWSEEFQSDYMSKELDLVFNMKRISGVALWQYFDTKSYTNCGGLRNKPMGVNYAGLLDAYRRPKLVYDTISKMYHNKQK